MSFVATVKARDVVRVTGADAASFLQGQISQDLDTVAPGASAWSLVLAPQGKLDAWFRLSRGLEGDFLLDLDTGFAPPLVERLARFRLRVDATFEVLAGWRMLSARGSAPTGASWDAVGAVDAPLRAAVRWPGFEGLDLIGPDLQPPSDRLPLDPDRFEVQRIRAGWPVMGRELTDRTIPAEIGGLVEASVSFTKGCYTGQELVARIDSRGGNVPRRLRLLEIRAGGQLEHGTTISADGRAVGEITSAAVDPDNGVTVALGVVHRRVEPPATVQVDGHPADLLPTPA